MGAGVAGVPAERAAATAFALSVCLTACFACKSQTPHTFRDSEERSFEARCHPDGACTLEQRSGQRWPAEAPEVALHTSTRIVGVCRAGAEAAPDRAADCRALVCGADADCPPAHGLDHGTCLNGLCTDQSHPVAREDAVMLCLFGAGLGGDTPARVERAAMGRNCGNPCEIPSACRKL